MNTTRRVLILVLVPSLVFVGGVALMNVLCGSPEQHRLENECVTKEKALNLRLRGYDATDADSYWCQFNDEGIKAELCLLELDIAFPLFYGSALLASLLLGWRWLGRRFPARWVVAPVVVIAAADCMENVIHIAQLQRWVNADAGARAESLQAGWIRVASAATVVKLWLSLVVIVVIVAAAGAVVALAVRRRRIASAETS